MALSLPPTPVPPWHTALELPAAMADPPRVSLVLSLYNYGHCVIDTLDSVAAQSLGSIELLVIDDASTDQGPQRVEAWLRQHPQRFAGARLLRHQRNAGLAAARNTGFGEARASWVWVQDADNPLAPRALEQCLCLAERVEPTVAVVHPLLLTVPEGASPQVFQGEGRPWQRALFEPANGVDAMALVRRSAWLAVGGYVHIPGGWEDYDFWCSLIEAGWSGVQCPQPLGCYTHHAASMTARTALPNVRRLEQLLRQRHPWLHCVGRTPAG
jgi:glycosyltransferase involved in cell wall biosynthesis